MGAVVQCNGTVQWYSAVSTVGTVHMYIPCIMCWMKCMKTRKTQSYHIAVFTLFSMHMCDSDLCSE